MLALVHERQLQRCFSNEEISREPVPGNNTTRSGAQTQANGFVSNRIAQHHSKHGICNCGGLA